MRIQRTPVNDVTFELCQVGEMRRRIADCRERLRRNRAARRIAEQAAPHTSEFAEEPSGLTLASAGFGAREEGS